MAHPKDCYGCHGTGRVIGFGWAHGRPCPGHDEQCEPGRCVCLDVETEAKS